MKRRFTLMKGLVEEALKNVSQRLLMMVSVMKAQGKNVLTGVLLSPVFFVASFSQERNVLLSQYDSCHRHAPEQRIAPFAIQAVGSPLVRLAYVIPSNRKPQANGVVNLQNAIKKGQQWYREQMEQNGFGPKTFAVETEADGVTPLVHVVNVTETDEYLRGDIWGRSLQAAINAGLSIWGTGEVWVVIPEAHLMLSDGTVTGGIAGGAGSGNGNSSGVAMISSNALPLYDPAMIADDTPYDGEVLPALGPFPMKQDVTFAWFEGRTLSSIASSWQGALVHEMGHAFGLAHDFRNDNNFHGNLMGNGLRGIRGNLFPQRYPQDYTRLEFAAASILNLNHYFNRDKRSTSPPFVTFNNPGSVIPQQGLVNIIFQASDNDLLAFAHLRYDGNTVSEIPLQGSSATGTFAVPYYAKGATNSYIIAVHDVEGNITYHNIQVSVQGGHNQAPVPFMQINPPAPGENQSIELNASGSSDVDNALSSVVASWDVNNDGQFDTQPSTNKVVQHQYEYGGNYLIRLKLTDPAGGETISTPVSIKITGEPPPSGNNGTGLKGEYFNNINLTGIPMVNRVDPRVDFLWNMASPATGISQDNFSVRWTGQVEAPTTGNFVFSTVSDDGVRLWVNNLQVINNWTDHGPTTNNSAAIPLVAGTKYDIRMEFYEHTAGAVARLLWAYPGQAQQAIPQSRLYPGDAGTSDTEAPSVPSNLGLAFRPTESSFTLVWQPSTDNVGVTGYEVFRDGISIGTTSQIFFDVTTGLLPGTTYLMTVRARDAAGNWSAQSAPSEVTTAGVPGTSGTGLQAEYFNNINLTGAPVVSRVDPRVDFVWNLASPAPGINPDNFSVRWTGQVFAPAPGNYVFSTVSDDGVRLWINGTQVINNWTDHGPTTNNSAPIPLLANTKYEIRMEFYEHTAGAVARLLWAYPGQAQQAIPQSRLYPGDAGTSDTEAPSVPSNLGLAFRPTESSFSLVWQSSTDNVGVTGYEVFRDGISIGTTSQIFFDVTGLLPGTTYLMTVRARDAAGNWSAQSAPSVVTTAGVPGTNGTGLQAEYFNNTNLTGAPVVSRVDPRVDFVWNLTSPAPGIYPDNFSVRWTGQVFAPVPGNYVFSTVSDDGIRLWINGTQVINNWTDHGPTTNNSAPIPLLANTKYEIRMEFYERTAGAVARLLWSYPGQPQQPIPQSRLFSSGGTTDVIAPTVPSGLASSNITQSSFTLSWTASTDNVGVTAYEVFRNGISIGTTSTTSLSITGLLSATKYAVTVQARDAIGNYSGQSSALDVTTAGTPTSGNGTGLRGEYFNNVNLTGTSLVNRVDPQVDFNWNLAAPAMGINPDNFSIRWSGQVEAPATANFVFSTVSDDGVRLWINGIQVINNWTDHGPTTNNSTTIPLVSGTKYDIRMEFYERTYGAVARLLWAYPGQAQQAIPQSRLYPSSGGSTSTGLSAAYFNNVNLTGTPVVNRVDSQVDFVWNLVSPATGINADNFSVRWTGQVEAVVSGNYIFSTVSDDGVRLFINGTQVINNWTDHGPTTNNSAAIPLTAGTRYDIRMEFYDHTYGAVAKLLWTYPGQAQQPIPQSRLYPAASISTTGIAAASLDQNGEQLSTEGDLTLISVYPNPASGGLINIKHEGKIEQAYVILMDDNGNVLLQRPLSEQPVEQLDISAVREGIHYLRVVSPEGEQIIRLVVE